MRHKARTGQRGPKKVTTFKERLKILMGNDRPYSWCKKVGIEKGLFQYYWQKGKIPKYENLLKIRNFTDCSLDWLMTGEGEPFPDRIESVVGATHALIDDIEDQIGKMERHVGKLRKLKSEMKEMTVA